MPNEKTEFEIVLRDSISPGLRSISRSLRALNKLSQENAGAAATNTQNLNRQMRGFGQQARAAGRELAGIGAFIRGSFGGVGSALGAYAVIEAVKSIASSLSDMATRRVQLAMFSRDTRIAADDIERIRGAIERMGATSEQADGYIAGLSGKLQELQAFKEGSGLFQQLSAMGQEGVNLAKELINEKDYMKAIRRIAEVFKRQGPTQQSYLVSILGIPASILENLEENIRKVKIVGPHIGMEDAQKFLDNQKAIREKVDNEWTIFGGKLLEDLNKLYEKLATVTGSKSPIADWAIKNLITDTDIKELEYYYNLYLKIKEIKPPTPKEAKSAIQDKVKEFHEKAAKDAITPSSAKANIRDRFGRFSKTQPTSVETVEQQRLKIEENRNLTDINEILKRMDESDASDDAGTLSGGGFGGGGGGGSTPPPGGGVSGQGAVTGQQVRGYNVDTYGGQTGETLYEPMTGWMGGGVGGDSAKFGRGQHQGVDIMGPQFSPVYAVKDGVIIRAPSPGAGYDQVLVIKHADGTYTRYLHQNFKNGISAGQKVKGGDVVGASGERNAPHTHFEWWRGPPGAAGSTLINPKKVFDWDAKKPSVGGRRVKGGGPNEPAKVIPDTQPPEQSAGTGTGARNRDTEYDTEGSVVAPGGRVQSPGGATLPPVTVNPNDNRSELNATFPQLAALSQSSRGTLLDDLGAGSYLFPPNFGQSGEMRDLRERFSSANILDLPLRQLGVPDPMARWAAEQQDPDPNTLSLGLGMLDLMKGEKPAVSEMGRFYQDEKVKQWEDFARDKARDTIDNDDSVFKKGTNEIKFLFNNVPPGVKTDVDAGGSFSKVEVSRKSAIEERAPD